MKWFDWWAWAVEGAIDVFAYVLCGGLLGFVVNLMLAGVVMALGYGEKHVPLLLAISPTLLGAAAGYVSLLASRAKEREEARRKREAIEKWGMLNAQYAKELQERGRKP